MTTIGTSYNVAPNPNDSTASILPIGSVLLWTTNTAPAGWFICNGQLLSRTQFASLFSVIGTTWGGGDGNTTFNVPNCAGVVVRGVNANFPQASGGGQNTIMLAANQLAFHGHNINDPGHNHPATQNSSNGYAAAKNNSGTDSFPNGSTGSNVTGITIQPSLRDGQDNPVTQQQPVNIVNPYIAMNYIIKAL